jgi:high-affinity nickel-transport protein
VILVGILRVVAALRRGECSESELERRLDERGLMNRVFGRFARAVSAPWQMYPIGLLFGLGFDTATEVALLFLAAGAAGAGLPFAAIVCLPVLFAAGMCLLDTLDGSFMGLAYGWAFARPARKVFYNLTVTALSVFVALAIGSVEIAGLLAEKLSLSGGVWGWAAGVDLNAIGFALVALFVLTWAVALGIWRFGRIEERWSRVLERR